MEEKGVKTYADQELSGGDFKAFRLLVCCGGGFILRAVGGKLLCVATHLGTVARSCAVRTQPPLSCI